MSFSFFKSALFGVLFILPFQAYGGAFVQKDGAGFFSAEYWSYSTMRYWDRQGIKRFSNNHFQKKELNLYTEYGLTAKDTIFGKALYDWIEESAHGSTIGLEDPECGWRRKLWEKKDKYVSSAQFSAIIPSGPANRPSLRYGRFGAELLLMHAGVFKHQDRYGFWDFNFGYRWFQGYPSDQIRVNAALGYDFTKKVQGIIETNLEYGVYNGQAQLNQSNIVLDPNYRLLKVVGHLRYRVTERSSAVVGFYRHVWGRNTGTGGGFIAGVWIDYGGPSKKDKEKEKSKS